MKTFFAFVAVFCIAPSAFSQLQKDQVLVSIRNSDEQVALNVIDLAGTWTNVASTRPIVGSNVPQGFVELTMAHAVDIRDAWAEDYAGRVRNCTWKIVDGALQFYSPDLGKVDITLEKLEHGIYYEFMLNNVTYRKLVNISKDKSSRKSL